MTYIRPLLKIALLAALCPGFTGAQAPPQPPAATILTVTGDLPKPVTLTDADLLKMPRETVAIPEQDGTKIDYQGVSLREILKRAGAPLDKQLRGKALSTYVLAKAHDGYQVVFTLAEVAPEFGNEPILVADQRDGKPLFGYQGPFRLVCGNDKEGARSVRMLEKLEVVQLNK